MPCAVITRAWRERLSFIKANDRGRDQETKIKQQQLPGQYRGGGGGAAWGWCGLGRLAVPGEAPALISQAPYAHVQSFHTEKAALIAA